MCCWNVHCLSLNQNCGDTEEFWDMESLCIGGEQCNINRVEKSSWNGSDFVLFAQKQNLKIKLPKYQKKKEQNLDCFWTISVIQQCVCVNCCSLDVGKLTDGLGVETAKRWFPVSPQI